MTTSSPSSDGGARGTGRVRDDVHRTVDATGCALAGVVDGPVDVIANPASAASAAVGWGG